MKYLILAVIVATSAACDMRGDTDPRYKTQNNPGGDGEVNFYCDSNVCFTGTQYCLRVLDQASGALMTSKCVNYSSNTCKDRQCISRDVQEANPTCYDPYYDQDQAKITVTCRIPKR